MDVVHLKEIIIIIISAFFSLVFSFQATNVLLPLIQRLASGVYRFVNSQEFLAKDIDSIENLVESNFKKINANNNKENTDEEKNTNDVAQNTQDTILISEQSIQTIEKRQKVIIKKIEKVVTCHTHIFLWLFFISCIQALYISYTSKLDEALAKQPLNTFGFEDLLKGNISVLSTIYFCFFLFIALHTFYVKKNNFDGFKQSVYSERFRILIPISIIALTTSGFIEGLDKTWSFVVFVLCSYLILLAIMLNRIYLANDIQNVDDEILESAPILPFIRYGLFLELFSFIVGILCANVFVSEIIKHINPNDTSQVLLYILITLFVPCFIGLIRICVVIGFDTIFKFLFLGLTPKFIQNNMN